MIYTAGYQGHTVQQLIDAAGKWASIIDIRLSPRSSIPGWGGAELEAALRAGQCGYFHRPEWGNLNFKGGPILINNFDEGLRLSRLLLSSCSDCVLLCVCRNYETCHRKVVADNLIARGYEVKELDWGGHHAGLFDEAAP